MPAKKKPVLPPHPEASKIVALRRAGMSFDKIARAVKPEIAGPVEAEAVWERCIEQHRAKYSTALELDRLDSMLVGVWTSAAAGDTDAIDRVLKIMAMRERLAPVPKTNDGALAKAYDESVEASTVTTKVDAALVAAGRTIAARIDEALASGDGMEVTKALYLVPHMMNALRELLATPSARLNAGITAGKGQTGGSNKGTLGSLRSIAGGKG